MADKMAFLRQEACTAKLINGEPGATYNFRLVNALSCILCLGTALIKVLLQEQLKRCDERARFRSLSGDGGGGLSVVAGEEGDVEAHLAQRVHRQVRLRLQRVRDGEHGHEDA